MRPERYPQITLSPEESAQYDQAARTYLLETVAERAKVDPQHVDPSRWEFVTRRKEVSVYHSTAKTSDSSVLLMMATGLIDGSMEDVLSGQYFDTTGDKIIADTVLGYPLAGGAVMAVADRRTEKDPYRFAGIKWMAFTSVHGLMKERDIFAYQRMGTTIDTEGNPMGYMTLQSIRRPEWPMEAIPGMQSQHTATCYLYRPRRDLNKTEIFLWGSVYRFGKYPRPVIYFGAARTWLTIVRVAKAGYAKKFSALIDRARTHGWGPSR